MKANESNLKRMDNIGIVVELLDEVISFFTELVDEIVQYEESYRLCYIRGPERILIGLAEELNKN
jgi:hypothetical protein